MKTLFIAAAVAATACLVACAPQESGTHPRHTDTKAYEGAPTAFAAPGWKGGDQTQWNEQLRSRAQTQNEYNRAP